MLSFAAFSPHPPIIVPEVGGEDSKYCQATIDAMKRLADSVEDKDIDTVVFISPHTTLSPEHMIVSYNEKASGSFASFGHPEVSYQAKMDLELADDIIKISRKNGLKVRQLHQDEDFFLDHGVLVPLYFLSRELNSTVKVLVIGFSANSRSEHFSFGQSIADAIRSTDKNIAVVASGDLSHRNLEYGAEEVGQKFDKLIVKEVTDLNPSEILKLSPDLQEEAGECGYRSLLILLGILDDQKVSSKVLSYEAPFGVGYMVAEFVIMPNI